MKFRLTALNVTALLFIAGCIIAIIVDFDNLSSGEGWGIVLMFGLIGLGLSALLIDWIVRLIFKKSEFLHLISAVITLIFIFLFFAGL